MMDENNNDLLAPENHVTLKRVLSDFYNVSTSSIKTISCGGLAFACAYGMGINFIQDLNQIGSFACLTASIICYGLSIKYSLKIDHDWKRFTQNKEIYQQLKIAATEQKELAAGQLSLEEKVQGEISLCSDEGRVSLISTIIENPF